MTYTLRIRVVVIAALLAVLLAVSAATPILSDGGTACAADCGGSGC
jgi:hypothetical protein